MDTVLTYWRQIVGSAPSSTEGALLKYAMCCILVLCVVGSVFRFVRKIFD